MATPLQYSCLETLHGQRRLVGYSSWGRKELNTTEQLTLQVYVIANHLRGSPQASATSSLILRRTLRTLS